ncbi:sulfatase-like hydrolase/transferase [Phycisphaeraceae bacterium D3-23]
MRVLSLALLLAFISPLANAQADNPPNVVLFMVDDFGWTDWQYDAVLNPTGSMLYETPNMLRLAQHGVNFTNAYSANAVCSPSRAAVITGKDPARIRITDWIPGGNWQHPTLQDPSDWDVTLNDSETTLAEALQENGYDTVFIGKWHLGTNGSDAANPFQNGFDVNIAGGHRGNPGNFFAGDDRSFNLPGMASNYQPSAYLPDVLSSDAIRYLQERPSRNETDPFFLYMSHYAVHTPIQAPAATVQYYQNKLDAGGDFGEHDHATYAAMVHHVDLALGRLMDELEAQGILDETLIILASDNGGLWAAQGDPTSNAPLRAGKGSWYEGGIRTPLIVAWPGNNAFVQGVLCDDVIIGHDIYTTVLELTGTQGSPAHNASTDGVSFAPGLCGEQHDRGTTFWHYPHIADQDHASELVSGGTYLTAARSGDWKLMYFYADQSWELYNLSEDLGETTNLAGEHPDIVATLGQEIVDYLIEIDAQLPVDQATGEPVAPPSIDQLGLGDIDSDSVSNHGDVEIHLANSAADPDDYLAPLAEELRKTWPDNRTVNIVCHGHSVPAGYFQTPRVDTFNSYPHLMHVGLNERYPNAVINVIVTAIGGEASPAGAARFEREVLNHDPDLLLIDYALNDRGQGLERSEAAWREMIEAALERNIPMILLTPTAALRADLADPDDPLNQHAELVRALAKEYGVALVDSYAGFKQHVADGGDLLELMSHGVHPNRAGHDLVAQRLLCWFPSE